jgi:hypothetical protein
VPDQTLSVLIPAVKYFNTQVAVLHYIAGLFAPKNGPHFLRAGVNLKTVLVILHTDPWLRCDCEPNDCRKFGYFQSDLLPRYHCPIELAPVWTEE